MRFTRVQAPGVVSRVTARARRGPSWDHADMDHIAFPLEPGREFVELNQLLKLVGIVDSGGAGKALVASGVVRVDGSIETRKTAKIRVGQQVRIGTVEIDVTA
jgi:ribosome-associated protein